MNSIRLPLPIAALLCAASLAQAQTPTAPPAPRPQAPQAVVKGAPAGTIEAKASEACSKALNIPEANRRLNPAPFIKNCIDDIKLSGTFNFIDGHKNAYLAKVKAMQSAPAPKKPAAKDAGK